MRDAGTIVNDAPEVFDLWKPKNFETGEYLGPVRLRDALAKSINTVSIRAHVRHQARDGRRDGAQARASQSELPTEMSIALGAGEVTPLEIVNAYATLAAGGMLRDAAVHRRDRRQAARRRRRASR